VNKNLSQKISVVVDSRGNNGTSHILKPLIIQLDLLGYDFELLVLNDGLDNLIQETARLEKLNDYSNKIKIFNLPPNLSCGFALSRILGKTRGDPVCLLDHDSDLSAKNLRVALAYFDQYQADIIVSSKHHPKSNLDLTFSFRFLSCLSQGLLKFLFNLNLSDPQIALGVFRRELLEKIIPRLKFGSFLELLILAHSFGYKKIVEAPIVFTEKSPDLLRLEATKNVLLETLAIFGQKVFARTYLKPTPQPHLIKV
jgi:glycosyltransferase involved in cell wall biosynthesis